MNEDVKNIIDELTDKLSLQNKTAEELSAIAERYPYFAFPKFLLAKKLAEENSTTANDQLRKVALYFSNPFWLNYLLSKDDLQFHEVPTQEEVAEDVIEEDSEETTANADTDFQEEQPSAEEAEAIEQTEFHTEEKIPVEESDEEKVATTADTEIEIAKEKIPVEENAEEKNETTHDVEIDEIIPAAEYTEEEIRVEHKEAFQNEPAESTTEEEKSEPADQIQEVSNAETPGEEIRNESETETEDETEAEEALNEEHEKLSKLIAQHLSEFKKPVEGSEEIPLETRVYHAIDYFASQGIKLDPRLITQDMLGSKVKKFTDWLKQMKRVNQNPTDLGTDAETEHLIEKIAQASNETKDVITETMAQILAKQGKNEKAIQLYQKLSFLNPSKYAYFAAKINELKGLQ
jgi:hypothetical protein